MMKHKKDIFVLRISLGDNKKGNVRTESLLHFLVYNMKRAINIVGTKQLIGILQG